MRRIYTTIVRMPTSYPPTIYHLATDTSHTRWNREVPSGPDTSSVTTKSPARV